MNKLNGFTALHVYQVASDIKAEVDRYFEMDIKHLSINSKSRKIVVMRPRQICHYFGSKFTGTLTEVGAIFGNKDHATVIHSKRTINALIEPCSTGAIPDPSLKYAIDTIETRLLYRLVHKRTYINCKIMRRRNHTILVGKRYRKYMQDKRKAI